MPGGKNLAGTFHQPAAVFADLNTLRSLPKRHFTSGCAEIVKCGIIGDAELFSHLEEHCHELEDPSGMPLAQALVRAARVKGEIVSEDEKEAGKRKILNAGHTFGHAIEALSEGEILHGEAIAIGLALESELAMDIERLSEGDYQRILHLIGKLGLPAGLPDGYGTKKLLDYMVSDKKNRGDRIAFALPSGIGTYTLHDDDWVALFEYEKIQLFIQKL
jgi:3-dehydroquinate synthetase